MKRLESQLATLRGQLDAAPWLRVALPLIGLLFLVFVWDSLETLRIDAQETAIEREVDLRRIRSLEGEEIWFQRAEESRQLLETLRAELPLATTPGLAQASLQSWLRDTALAGIAADTVRINVESTEPIDALPGVLRVRVSINGPMSARQAMGVIRQIESSSNLLVIETAMIRSDQNRMFTATLNAYYRVQTAEAAP